MKNWKFMARASAVAAIGGWMLLASAGCRNKQERPNVIPLEGKVEKISLKSDDAGEITVSYTDQNQGLAKGTGLVTSETDIMINGAVSVLKDLQEGDRVRGEVKVVREGDERKHVVLRIRVERASSASGGKGP
jgi:transcription termination factor Rho